MEQLIISSFQLYNFYLKPLNDKKKKTKIEINIFIYMEGYYLWVAFIL